MELLEKLAQLERNITVLEEIRQDAALEATVRNTRFEWEVRYGLFESIQIIIDVSCKIVNHYNLGVPNNYRECLELLQSSGYLDAALTTRCIAMTGLRNLLIHEYAQIDPEKLYDFLNNLNDLKSFITQLSNHL